MNNENSVVNSLRFLSVESVEKANSGHPGITLGAAPMAYALWGRHLNFNPEEKDWINRDRFILSAGHGSAILYSLLHMYGYNLSVEDLKNFRQLNSKTPGHPEYKVTDGVDASTGPLGQGISMGVGMAIAETMLASKYNKEDIDLINHYTYVLCGDGDLMEGISYEACSLAGTLGLNKLIVLYDSNSISIEGETDGWFKEDVKKRFDGFGFQVLEIQDGNDIEKISAAIDEAKAEKERPTIIIVKTQIAYGVQSKVGKASSHGSPLGGEGIKEMRDFYKWNYKPFEVPEEAKEIAKSQLESKKEIFDEWKQKEEEYKNKYPEDYENFKTDLEGKLPENLFDEDYFKCEKDMATRAASGVIINKIAQKISSFMGGSGDLGPSNKTEIKEGGWYSKENRSGRNIHFGVREHGMAAIGNGIALHGGLRTFVATFMVFSDYLKGAMRLSSIMGVPLTYILTHDSIGVGEDGPTHQPIEQLAMMRSLPNFHVIRPADFKETAYAWKFALESKDTPVALALTRQNLPNLEHTGAGVLKGGYILEKESKNLELILIASGSELNLCVELKKYFEEKNIGTRVVSMPCMTIFDLQDEDYKESVLPKKIRKRVSVEALSTFGWGKYVGIDGLSIGIDTFGASGKAEEVFEYFGITTEKIKSKILDKFNF